MAASPRGLTFLTILLISPLLLVAAGTCRCPEERSFKYDKMFVFGDSYVDTGNMGTTSNGRGWIKPYGMTFPGKPAGRYSNGRLYTDFVAKMVGIQTPLPYKFRRAASKEQLSRGMNFAYAGTGVFETELGGPTMTKQIDNLENMIVDGTYTADDLKSSVAIVSLAGNDYNTHMDEYPDTDEDGWLDFINQVLAQLQADMLRIYKLGVRRIGVNTLPPLGCLPTLAVKFSYQSCDQPINMLSGLHNLFMQDMIKNLTDLTRSKPEDNTFLLIDLDAAFDSVLGIEVTEKNLTGNSAFPDPLRPCCIAEKGALCGHVDVATERKLYTVCEDPASSFFWDTVHPTQAGWRRVVNALKSNITTLFS